jgi:Rad3-related DNA helicase
MAVGKLCEGCVYIQARQAAEAASMALFNFHSYFTNKMYKNVAIIDEGHGAVDLLYSLFGRKLWKCEVDYPDDLELNPSAIGDVVGGVVTGLELRFAHLLKNKADSSLIERMEEEIESLKMLHQALYECGNEFLIRKKTELYFGEVTACKKTEQEYIYVKPLNIDKLAEKILWPRDKVNKIILTSATIGKQDIELLGLSDRKIAYHESKSNIPKNSRLFIVDPVASMTYKNRQESLPKIVKKIKDLATVHKGQKGVVHCTYEVALQIKSMLGEGGRFMYHNNFNKDAVLSAFMATKSDKILIASGMAEGIDLKDDLARFQIIIMLQFPSMADDVMNWIAKNRPKRYKWMAIRNLVQQAGRISRHPKDYGITYFIGAELDKRFYYDTEGMWPMFFKEAMVWL